MDQPSPYHSSFPAACAGMLLIDLNLADRHGADVGGHAGTIARIQALCPDARITMLGRAASATAPAIRALSPRELDILEHLSAGKSNKVIARLAGIGVGTVKYHVNNILSKLNVSCRTEAASVAFRRGMLQSFPVSAITE
jgi:DNA-binding CsgD family transcriptional regulator